MITIRSSGRPKRVLKKMTSENTATVNQIIHARNRSESVKKILKVGLTNIGQSYDKNLRSAFTRQHVVLISAY